MMINNVGDIMNILNEKASDEKQTIHLTYQIFWI